MNNVLELKGKRFVQASRGGRGGGAAMNSKKTVSSEELQRLQYQLRQIKEFWEKEKKPFEGILISVYYNKIAAKSNRISGLFKGNKSNSAIVGAKFNDEKIKHIITYFLDITDLDKSIELLSKAGVILRDRFRGQISKDIFDDNKLMNRIPFDKYSMSKSVFKQVIADVSYIDSFEVESATLPLNQSIITLYNTKTI